MRSATKARPEDPSDMQALGLSPEAMIRHIVAYLSDYIDWARVRSAHNLSDREVRNLMDTLSGQGGAA